MNMVKYFVLTVLYNKTPKESSTIVSLSTLPVDIKRDIRIVVWNNSSKDYSAAHKKELDGMLADYDTTYIFNNGKNLPLSVIYNRTIGEMLHDEEVLVIMDDDSIFGEDMFAKSTEAIERHSNIDLFLPIVYNGSDIVSPAYMNLFKGHYFKSVTPGITGTHHITAINSGMMIRARYLKHGFEGYDENIKFYFTDNDFMSRYDASHDKLYVLDYKMIHTLDFYKKGEPYEKKKRRFRDLRRAFLILMKRKGWAVYAITYLYLIVYSVKFAIKQRDIRYIFVF